MESADSENSCILVLAIQALAFDEESRKIKRHSRFHLNLMRDTFLRKLYDNIEGAGSRFEGLDGRWYPSNDEVEATDTDFVKTVTEVNLPTSKKTIVVENDLQRIYDPEFPGYVKLKVIKRKNNCVKLSDYIPNNIFFLNTDQSKKTEIKVKIMSKNGPATTTLMHYGSPPFSKSDTVTCFVLKSWPDEASKWINRCRPNNWPSTQLIEEIKSKGLSLAPVGHYDCEEQEIQWRIGIRGETELVLNLNETQIYCYVALRKILKDDISKINDDVLSSFHMKNVVFWCAEQETCLWTMENFKTCLKVCLKKLMHFITSGKFPYYFIEDRNLINSKMTPALSERIVKALERYENNPRNILSLKSFVQLKMETQFNVQSLKAAKQKSIIRECIAFYLELFGPFIGETNRIWETYQGHCTKTDMTNALRVLSVLKKNKRFLILHHISYTKNILGLLYYARYNQSGLKQDQMTAMKLLMRPVKFQIISLQFRVATFLFMEHKLEDCLKICDWYLMNPSKYKTQEEKGSQVDTILSKMYTLLRLIETNVKELTDFKNKMLKIFYSKKKSFNHKNDGTLQHKLLWIYTHFPYFVFRDLSFNVAYLASEKWAVPDVFQYELLSVTEHHPESSVFGIYISPMLNCLVLKFLCCHHKKKWENRDDVMATMCEYVRNPFPDNKKTYPAELPHSLPLYRVYNIVAYCCVKAGRYNQAVHYILNSFRLNKTRKNTAYGYIRYICDMLNSCLSVGKRSLNA